MIFIIIKNNLDVSSSPLPPFPSTEDVDDDEEDSVSSFARKVIKTLEKATPPRERIVTRSRTKALNALHGTDKVDLKVGTTRNFIIIPQEEPFITPIPKFRIREITTTLSHEIKSCPILQRRRSMWVSCL